MTPEEIIATERLIRAMVAGIKIADAMEGHIKKIGLGSVR
jgi:hypothetical protein